MHSLVAPRKSERTISLLRLEWRIFSVCCCQGVLAVVSVENYLGKINYVVSRSERRCTSTLSTVLKSGVHLFLLQRLVWVHGKRDAD